jgi:predicted transcriptional regulator
MRWTEDVEDRGLTLEEMAEELKVDLALIKTTVDELLDAGAIGANGWEVGQ